MQPEISVIIPAHNTAAYLPELFGCLSLQTYRRLHIIFCNDGSTDATPALLETFRQNPPSGMSVSVTALPGLGPGAARNACLPLVTSDYISFIDSDDLINIYYYEEMIKYLKPDVMPIMHREQFTDGTLPDTGRRATNRLRSYHGIMTLVYRGIYRTDVIRKHNIRFPENTRHFEDGLFNLDYFEHCDPLIQDTHAIYYYRLRSESVSHTGNLRARLAVLRDGLAVIESRISGPGAVTYRPLVQEKLKEYRDQTLRSISELEHRLSDTRQ